MENKPYKRIDVSRPTDESLEAYKTWMMELAKMLTTDPIKWTEEEWMANWQKSWREKSDD